MYRYFYESNGTIQACKQHHDFILMTESVPGSRDANGNQTHTHLWVDDPIRRDVNVWKYLNGAFIPYVKPEKIQDIPWDQQRRDSFGSAEQQLNLLADDIKNNLFGEQAKTSSWYQHIVAVKTAIPKE